MRLLTVMLASTAELTVRRAGGGGAVASVQLYVIMFGIDGPLVCSGTLECVFASDASGVGCLLGTEERILVCDKLLAVTIHLRNLKQFEPVVCRLSLKLHMRGPQQQKWIHDNRFDGTCDALGAWKSGIWLVRLLRPKGKRVDH